MFVIKKKIRLWKFYLQLFNFKDSHRGQDATLVNPFFDIHESSFFPLPEYAFFLQLGSKMSHSLTTIRNHLPLFGESNNSLIRPVRIPSYDYDVIDFQFFSGLPDGIFFYQKWKFVCALGRKILVYFMVIWYFYCHFGIFSHFALLLQENLATLVLLCSGNKYVHRGDFFDMMILHIAAFVVHVSNCFWYHPDKW
jgi:hypothetical protein